MKKILILFVSFIATVSHSIAANETNNCDSLIKVAILQMQKDNNLARMSHWGPLITFLPVIFFLFILIVVLVAIRKSDISLCDFLIDKDVVVASKKEEVKIAEANLKATIAKVNAFIENPAKFKDGTSVTDFTENAPANAEDGNSTQDNTPPQSTSRLLVFISGVTSVAIAACITTFYFYCFLTKQTPVNLDTITNVLYGLGIGVIPYGVNKLAGVLGSSSSKPNKG